MGTLALLGIWRRLKRQLRSLIVRIGLKKPISWMAEFTGFMGILESLADARDAATTQAPQPQVMQDTPDSSPVETPVLTKESPESTKASPYDTLVPKK